MSVLEVVACLLIVLSILVGIAYRHTRPHYLQPSQVCNRGHLIRQGTWCYLCSPEGKS